MEHLLARAGFGASPHEVRYRGLSFESAVDLLVGELDSPAAERPNFDPYTPQAIERTWLDRMVSGEAPLAEKLALFWHGHFATSNAKVSDHKLMWQQYRLFRNNGAGRFEELALAVSRDPAMLMFLDGNSNRRGHPNENYARELMELFTLGVGHYSELDVREAARAFTGWGSTRGRFEFRADLHDAGPKTFLGHKGNLDGQDVLRILCQSQTTARFLARKLLNFFCLPNPSEAEVNRLAQVYRDRDGRIRDVLKAMFLDPLFQRSHKTLVKSPVEFLVGALRRAGQRSAPEWAVEALDRMGQALFNPPSVKGWPWGTEWLSTGALVERLHAAHSVANGQSRLALELGGPEFQMN